jgi:hypothetical protein
VLIIMSCTMPLKMLRDFILNPLRASGFDEEIAKVQFVNTALQILASVVAITTNFQYTIWAIATATIVISLATVYRGLHYLGLSIRKLCLRSIPPACSTLLMLCIGLLVFTQLNNSTPAVQLLLVIAASAITFSLTALFTMPKELKQIFANKIRRS